MASRLRDICFDCTDHQRVARFWADVLGYRVRPPQSGETADDPVAIDSTEGYPSIWYSKVPEPKVVKNRVHIDIDLPDGVEMERLHRLGARTLKEIRDAQGTLKWAIMADPEGNEFCAFPSPR
jgi:hypothetical protein